MSYKSLVEATSDSSAKALPGLKDLRYRCGGFLKWGYPQTD